MRKTVSTTKRRIRAALKALNLDLFKPEMIVRPAPATLYTKLRQERARQVVSDTISLGVRRQYPSGDDQLVELFDRYNWIYFGGQLSAAQVIWSTRMMTAGSYSPSDRTIRIGRKYHDIFPEELADTLKHEMIHIKHLNHDAAFKREATRIGASLRAKPHESLRKPARYLYGCPSCGIDYPRQKRIRMASCGHCSKGRFDRRFKLTLKKSLL